MMKIDVTNDEFEPLVNKYGIEETPRMIVLDKMIPILDEPADDEVVDKIKSKLAKVLPPENVKSDTQTSEGEGLPPK